MHYARLAFKKIERKTRKEQRHKREDNRTILSSLKMITPSRNTIADNMTALLKKYRPGITNVELASFKSRLVKDDFIDVGTISYDCLSDFESLISFDLNFTWEWSEETLLAPSSCQKLVINIFNLSIIIRRKVQNEDAHATRTEENSSESGNNKDMFLLSWFLKCTPIVEVIVNDANVEIDPNLDFQAAQKIVFELWSTGFSSTLSFSGGTSSLLTKNQNPIITFHTIIITHKTWLGRTLKFTLKGCTWEPDTTSWKIKEAVIQYPFLVYHLSATARGVEMEFSTTSIVAAIFDKLTAFRLDGEGFSLHLKYMVPNVNIVYTLDQGLQISLSNDFILSNHHDVICMNALPNIPLSCPIALTVSKFTLYGKEDDMYISTNNCSIELTNGNISTNVIIQADAFHFGKFIQISSFSLQCALDGFGTTADSFQLKMGLVSFQPSDEGVKWLERCIHSLEFTDNLNVDSQLKVPFGCISEVEVHFQKSVMNVFDFSKYRLENVLGDEESTISSLLLLNVRRLLKEVIRRRKEEKEQRKDMADSAAISAGSVLLATSVATPIGAAVSIAALGIRDQVGKAVISGKQDRGVTEHESYKFGDFSRGLVAKFRKSSSSQSDTPSKDSILRDKRRLAGVGGMSAGAIAGSVLLGPIGIAAGAMIGSRVAKAHATSEENNFSDDEIEDE